MNMGRGMGTQLGDALKALGLGASKQGKPGALASTEPAPGGDAAVEAASGAAQPSWQVGVKKLAAPAPHGPPRNASPNPSGGRRPSRRGGMASPMAGASRRTPAIAAAPLPAAKPPPQTTRLHRVGDFHPNPLFIDDPSDGADLPMQSHDGIARQLTDSPENETDLVIGLDFGTSATKVVIRDAFAATSVFPVQFDPERQGVDGHLIPSRVFRTGGVYSLNQGTHRIANLKLSLLACQAVSPVTEFRDCCAFLALVIRRARGWFLSTHRDIYSRHQLNWRLNLGLAARSYQDDRTVRLFRRLAWAASNLADDRTATEITTENVEEYRLLSLEVMGNEDSEGFPFNWKDVDAVPEVSAQLQGFMSSARWDWQSRPVMMLVDIGAGSVDSALFHVRVPESGPGVLTFYASRVEQNGVMNLHRARVDWLRGLLPEGSEHAAAKACLEAIAIPTDRRRPIPESVDDYLSGYTIELHGRSIDQEFWQTRYRMQVAGSISDAKLQKGIPLSQLTNVPLLLCGGGSRMSYFRQIGEAINQTEGWLVSVETMRLPVPAELAEIGWHADDFDRLSVAYGLSLSGQEDTTLGRIVRAIEVPDAVVEQTANRGDAFVSKDQM